MSRTGVAAVAVALAVTLPWTASAGAWSPVREGAVLTQPQVPALAGKCKTAHLRLVAERQNPDIIASWTLSAASAAAEDSAALPDAATATRATAEAYGIPQIRAPRSSWIEPELMPRWLVSPSLHWTPSWQDVAPTTSDDSAGYRVQATVPPSVVWYETEGLVRPLLALAVDKAALTCGEATFAVDVETPPGWTVDAALPTVTGEHSQARWLWPADAPARQVFAFTIPEPNPLWRHAFEAAWWLLMAGVVAVAAWLGLRHQTLRHASPLVPATLIAAGPAYSWTLLALYHLFRDLVGGELIGGWPASRDPHYHHSAWPLWDVPVGLGLFAGGLFLGWLVSRWRRQ